MTNNLMAIESLENSKKMEPVSPFSIFTFDKDGLILTCNDSARLLWGREALIGKDHFYSFWSFRYADGKPMSVEESPFSRTLTSGIACNGDEIMVERPDHSTFHLLVYTHLEEDQNNEPGSIRSILVNITDQKKAEEQQALLSSIVNSSDDAIISKSLNGTIKSWNSGAEKTFGYSEQEAIGKHINMLVPDHLQQEEETILNSIRAGKIIDHYQTIRLHKNGNKVQVYIIVSPVIDSKGTIIGATKVARDITGRLQTEEVLKQSAISMGILHSISKLISEKENIQSLIQQITDAATKITHADFGAFFYNPEEEDALACKRFTLSGISEEKFEEFKLSRYFEILSPAFDEKKPVRMDDIRKSSGFGENLLPGLINSGSFLVASYLEVPILSSTGTLIGKIFFGHESPGMFRAEHEEMVISIASQAAQAIDNFRLFKKVNELNTKKDELIALASHELKSPLTALQGYLQLLENSETGKTAGHFISKSLKQVEKLSSLITELFDISKIEAGKLTLHIERFNLNELIQEVVESLQAPSHTHTLIFTSSVTAYIEGDKLKIEQVLVNLLNNAIKYSPQASSVNIELQETAGKALVRVIDKGTGLSPSQQKKVFTRLYRAEGTSDISGMGLGLYITKAIIDSHHGSIGLKSKPGEGSEFFFTLPISSSSK